MIHAAGILIRNKDGQALFLKRNAAGDMPGAWCFPGGKIEEGETAFIAAQRETKEETGWDADPKAIIEWTRRRAPQFPVIPRPVIAGVTPASTAAESLPPMAIEGDVVDFTTFMTKDVETFIPDIAASGEHVAYAWAPIDQPPEPLHPGCAIALARFTMDELGVARAMAAGELTSPQPYANMTLFDLRITGTGVAYRRKLDEFVWRDQTIYLNDEFLARCNGLAVVLEHPKSNVLNTKEFRSRNIGSIFLPYIRDEEVWGIAKILDAGAAKLMTDEQLSTSPAVVWRDPSDNDRVELESGSKLLIEGKPSLLDHLAICTQGVWDKGDSPVGVSTTIVSRKDDDTMNKLKRLDGESDDAYAARCREAEEAFARLDSNKDGMDAILKAVQAVNAKIETVSEKQTALEKRLDDDEKKKEDDKGEKERADARGRADAFAFSKRKDDDDDDGWKKRMDAEEDTLKKDLEAAGESKEVAADKAKKRRGDAEEADKKERADAARGDSSKAIDDLRAKIASLTESLPKPLSDADFATFANEQARADAVYSMFGDSAPRPMQGESVLLYKRRLMSGLQKHSPVWKDADLKIVAVDDATMEIAGAQIYEHAATAARNPSLVPAGTLRPVTKKLPSGHIVTEWMGHPSAWMQQFSPTQRFVTAIEKKGN